MKWRRTMKPVIRKCLLTLLSVLVFTGVMVILQHTVKEGYRSIQRVPQIADTPVYVECGEEETLLVTLQMTEGIDINSLDFLIVNTDEKGDGTIQFSLYDAQDSLLFDDTVAESGVTIGEWYSLPVSLSLLEGNSYVLSITPTHCSPYFMQTSLDVIERKLPFTEQVIYKDNVLSCGISLGIGEAEYVVMTFGDIFYFSVPICILALLVILFFIWNGYHKAVCILQSIPQNAKLKRLFSTCGCDIFLMLLFVFSCVSIYVRAVMEGIYITSDSTGYLREAVNLVAGNGFSYDGLAGYRSWFANWPILYPALIALVMHVTHLSAYLASKLLSMILVGLILLTLRLAFKKDAWVYALCIVNIGFMDITYYTWSELPFMLFMLLFGLVLAAILKAESPAIWQYIALGVCALACFLTRYFGAFLYCVIGLYICILLFSFSRKKELIIFKKALSLAITAFMSGMCGVFYLIMNRVMNGMASGVSRGTWWDDYEVLTNDLISSLLTEFFNAFCIQIPAFISEYAFALKALVLILILIGFAWFIVANKKPFTKESVLITIAVIYYGMFIAIRYVSSMDTFYFRFFEPATFLFTIGIIGILLPYVKGTKGFHFATGAITTLVVLSLITTLGSTGLHLEDSFYEIMNRQWAADYQEIPERSVVIFNDIDFRASHFRPDVVNGMLLPSDTMQSLQDTYYGSEYFCIPRNDAIVIIEEGDYDPEVKQFLKDALSESPDDSRYLVKRFR